MAFFFNLSDCLRFEAFVCRISSGLFCSIGIVSRMRYEICKSKYEVLFFLAKTRLGSRIHCKISCFGERRADKGFKLC